MTSCCWSSLIRLLFHLLKPQAIDCYWHILQSFSSRGWLSRELRNIQTDDYLELVDDVRHIYLNDFGTGPAIEDIVFFLSVCTELARREYNLHSFNLFCLCLGHIVQSMPKVELGCSRIGTANVDLSCINEPLQGYLLFSDLERNFFTDVFQLMGVWRF